MTNLIIPSTTNDFLNNIKVGDCFGLILGGNYQVFKDEKLSEVYLETTVALHEGYVGQLPYYTVSGYALEEQKDKGVFRLRDGSLLIGMEDEVTLLPLAVQLTEDNNEGYLTGTVLFSYEDDFDQEDTTSTITAYTLEGNELEIQVGTFKVLNYNE